MEIKEPTKTSNDQQKKKFVINMGGGGGGIGAVILLGGALATAALASAFVVRMKGRSSGKDRRHQNPPPELNEKNEEEATNKEPLFVFRASSKVDKKHPSSEVKKEVESEKEKGFVVSDKSLTLPRIEINGGAPGDVYSGATNEQILGSMDPKKSEYDAISNGVVMIKEQSHLSDEKLPFELKNMMDEAKIQLTKDVINEISKESHDFEQEEETAEGEANCDGEIDKMNHKEVVEVTQLEPIEEENAEMCCDQEQNDIDKTEAQKNLNMEVIMDEKELEPSDGNQEAMGTDNSFSETIVSESHAEEDGQETLDPVLETHVVEENNVSVEKKDNEDVEGGQENQVELIEEQLVKENRKNDQPGEVIIPKKCGLQIIVEEEKIPSENAEENEQFGVPILKEEPVVREDIEVIKEDGANEEVNENVQTNKYKTWADLFVREPKDNENDVESTIIEEVEEELIPPEDIEVEEDGGENEETLEILQVNEDKYFVPKDDEGVDVNESCETIDMEKYVVIMETSEDSTTDGYSDEEADETDISGEVEESSIETGDSSVESNEEAIWPIESLHVSSIEPQLVKLVEQEVVGKIREDKSVHGDSGFELHQVKSSENLLVKEKDEHDSKKSGEYMVDMGKLKALVANSTRRRMLMGMLTVMSSLSCSWFFEVSFVKLFLIMFFTVVLSEIQGY